MNALSALPIDKKAYRKLLSDALPEVIYTEEQNDRCVAALEALSDLGRLTPEQERLSELLRLLIEDFEDRHYQLKPASPIVIVKELMAANGLKQVHMVDVFGTRSVTSEVLSGKRNLSSTHIRKLSERFNVSPELFFDVPKLKSIDAAPRRRR